MRFNLKILTVAVGTLLPVLMSPPAWSANPISGVSAAQSDWTGVIEHVGSDGGRIVVDDREFAVGQDTSIHGRRSGRAGLSKGMTVDIRSQLSPSGSWIAAEIWVR